MKAQNRTDLSSEYLHNMPKNYYWNIFRRKWSATFNLLGIDEKKTCSDDFGLAIRKAACPRYAKTRQGRTRSTNIYCKVK